MNMKKLLLVIGMFTLLFMNVNAITYLNSCGKNSGWVPGETYIINFTEIPVSYATSYCFNIASSDADNFALIGTGEQIELKSTSVTKFIQWTSSYGYGNNYWSNITLSNINIVDVSGTPTDFIQTSGVFSSGWRANDIRYSNWNDLDVINFNVFIRQQSGNSGSLTFFYNNLDNIFFVGNYFQVPNLDVGLSGGYTTNVTNSALLNKLGFSTSNYVNTFYGFNFTDSVVLSPDNIVSKINSNYINVEFDSSVVSYFNHTDSDDNNLADSNLYTRMNNMNIYQDIRNYRFLQDSNEGQIAYFDDDKQYVIIKSDSISFSNRVSLGGQDNVTFLPFSDFIDLQGISSVLLGTNSKLSSFLNEATILDITNSSSSSGEEDGYILLKGNNEISGISFNLNRAGSEGNLATNLNFLNIINNVKIYDNSFNVNSEYSIATDEIFNLDTNNLEIYDNTFTMNTHNHDLFNIVDNTQANIYRNTFNVNTGNPNLFSIGGNVYLYNNNMDNNMSVSTLSNQGIYLNKTVTYLDSGTIYYFNIGNYWSDNTGCVDSNSDDICDSSFTIGSYTDNKPLAVYPFDFAANLLTADNSVPLNNFTVTLISPINAQSFDLASSSETIDVIYSHDSSFPDISCSILLDSIPIDTKYNVNTSTQTVGLTNWNSGDYSVQIYCANEYVESYSTTNNFSVTVGITNGGGNGGGNDTITDGGFFGGATDNFNLITDDIDSTYDNVNSLMASFSNTTSSVLLPLATIIFIFFIIFAVLNVLHIVK